MTTELWALLGVAVILFVAIIAQQIVADLRYGVSWALSNRDIEPDDPSPAVERMGRLVRNHVEGIAVFAPLAIISALVGASNPITQIAALVYLASRTLHLIFYALGVTPLRSLVWAPGFMLALPAFVYGLLRATGLPG